MNGTCQNNNHITTVAGHFHSQNDQLDQKKTIHILEYIRLERHTQVTLTQRYERVNLVTQLNTFDSQWPEYIRLRQSIQKELQDINKGHPALFAYIIQTPGSCSVWKQPRHLYFGDHIAPPCTANFTKSKVFIAHRFKINSSRQECSCYAQNYTPDDGNLVGNYLAKELGHVTYKAIQDIQ